MNDLVFFDAALAGGAIGFVLGAIAGSFLATILLRWPEGRSVLGGRSHCDGCGAPLRAFELIPLLSYLFARGRCRRCGGRIDSRHFAVELACALVGAVALALQPGPSGLVTALFGWWLLILAALDVEHHWLPDRLTLPLLPLGLGVAATGIGPDLTQRLIGAAVGYLILAAIAWAYRRSRGREGMGGGDPKLLAAIGAWLGWQQLPLVLVGAGLLGFAAIALLRLRGNDVRATDRLPLGTLMAVATWPIWLITSAS